jgi:glutathione S-transferase
MQNIAGKGVLLFLSAVAVGVLRRAIASSTTPNLRLWISKSCPYAARAWITLLEKGIDCELKEVDLQAKPADFNQLYSEINVDPSASSKVPILEDLSDGTRLIESAVIAFYLEEKFQSCGTCLSPVSAKDKALVRLFSETFSGTLQMMPYKCIQTTPETKDEILGLLRKNIVIVDNFLKKYGKSDGPFLLGKDFTFAEVMTVPFIQRLLPVAAHFCQIDVLSECKTAGCTRLLAWMDAVQSRKSVLATKMADEAIVAAYEAARKRLAGK